MAELKYKEITEKIIGASMRVHAALGNGFQEVIYQRALEIELEAAGVRFAREFNMPVFYKGKMIGERRVDFLIEDKISVELKAILKLEPVHFAQVPVNDDGTYQYRFRTLDVTEGKTTKIFEGDYTVKIFKVVNLDSDYVDSYLKNEHSSLVSILF